MLLYLKLQIGKCQIRQIRAKYANTGQIRGHITYLILAIEKITAERNGYVNELSYVSPDYEVMCPLITLITLITPNYFTRSSSQRVH